MCNKTKNNRVIVICPYCQAPSTIPKEVEQDIHIFTNYECWECNVSVPITKDLKDYIKATRSDEE